MPRKRTSPDARTAGVTVPQQELFSPDAYPPRPDLVAMVKGKSFIHNGTLLGNDEELCRNVCRDLVLGLSDRQIAKKWHISRSSIVPIELIMRARGELEPLKQEISDELGEVILMGLRNYKDALAGNLVNAAQLPIPMAALIDKKGQIDGNVIPGTNLTAPEITAEDIEREVAEMKRAVVIDLVPVEKQSVETTAKPA